MVFRDSGCPFPHLQSRPLNQTQPDFKELEELAAVIHTDFSLDVKFFQNWSLLLAESPYVASGEVLKPSSSHILNSSAPQPLNLSIKGVGIREGGTSGVDGGASGIFHPESPQSSWPVG